jgi:hypothetical protein
VLVVGAAGTELMSQEVENILCEDSGNICYPLRAPDAAEKNAAPISVSSDKLARSPTFFILETHFLRHRIFGCSCRLLLAILDIGSRSESVM